mmetsp:Transcript_51119/g.123404  ORF Transcript_51119/g.123404 Transcript_51119/m.123404 type:complete len:85 (+) Transcript_51119:114-368(+)
MLLLDGQSCDSVYAYDGNKDAVVSFRRPGWNEKTQPPPWPGGSTFPNPSSSDFFLVILFSTTSLVSLADLILDLVLDLLRSYLL